MRIADAHLAERRWASPPVRRGFNLEYDIARARYVYIVQPVTALTANLPSLGINPTSAAPSRRVLIGPSRFGGGDWYADLWYGGWKPDKHPN